MRSRDMRMLVLALGLAGCDPFTPTYMDPPWLEHVIARTAAATLVADTRDQCDSFPDGVVEYRIYRTASPWQLIASGSMQTQSWARAVDTRGGVTHLHLYARTCVLDATALRCADHPDTALDAP